MVSFRGDCGRSVSGRPETGDCNIDGNTLFVVVFGSHVENLLGVRLKGLAIEVSAEAILAVANAALFGVTAIAELADAGRDAVLEAVVRLGSVIDLGTTTLRESGSVLFVQAHAQLQRLISILLICVILKWSVFDSPELRRLFLEK